MARYSIATSKASAAAAGWLMGLRCPSTKDARVWEIGILNEASVAGTVGLRRVTTAGTGTPTSLVPVQEDTSVAAGSVTLDTAFSTAVPSSTANYIRRFACAATIGSGVIWTFPAGLVIPVSGALQIEQISTAVTTYGVYVVYDE